MICEGLISYLDVLWNYGVKAVQGTSVIHAWFALLTVFGATILIHRQIEIINYKFLYSSINWSLHLLLCCYYAHIYK